MNIENPLKELRILKGAPLSILFALMIVKQSVNAKWLCMITGYSDKTISEGLDLLCEFEYIKKITGQKWQIATSKQLPLMIENQIENENEISKKLYDELLEIGIGEPARTQLSKMDEEYIHAHIMKAKAEKIPPGLFIHKIRAGDPPPKLNEIGHLEYCECNECYKIKYPFVIS